MSIYLRGDPEPIRRIHEVPVGKNQRTHIGEPLLAIYLTDDEDEDPILTTQSRLVADGGASEIDAALRRKNGRA